VQQRPVVETGKTMPGIETPVVPSAGSKFTALLSDPGIN
jgi:hypothetical protein